MTKKPTLKTNWKQLENITLKQLLKSFHYMNVYVNYKEPHNTLVTLSQQNDMFNRAEILLKKNKIVSLIWKVRHQNHNRINAVELTIGIWSEKLKFSMYPSPKFTITLEDIENHQSLHVKPNTKIVELYDILY